MGGKMGVQEDVSEFKEKHKYGRFFCLVFNFEGDINDCLKRQTQPTHYKLMNSESNSLKKEVLRPQFKSCQGCIMWQNNHITGRVRPKYIIYNTSPKNGGKATILGGK
jgi:hypothetical protein